MDKQLIDLVAEELKTALIGTYFRSITQIGKLRFVMTLEGDPFRRLLISVEPRDPRIYLVRHSDRSLKKLAAHQSLFAIAVERSLSGMPFVSLEVAKYERIIEITFGEAESMSLVVQLTGSSSNLFVLNCKRFITAAARPSNVIGQSTGSVYSFRTDNTVFLTSRTPPVQLQARGRSISEALDDHFSKHDEEAEFHRTAESARAKNRQLMTKAERLVRNLENDLVEHGDAEKWRRFGDLLLASQNTAVRSPGSIEVVDFFDEAQAKIAIDADDNDSLPEAAQKYFRRYSKARNARVEVLERIDRANKEVERLREKGIEIEEAIERRNHEFFEKLNPARIPSHQTKKREIKLPSGIRHYISTDDFDILVGKKSTDNDYLTQRVAHSRDTWMHAADYPGSHVVIRNANRKEIPQRTLIEAAQLAAFFSQGKKQTKAAVNYTEKKFVSKPKGAAPGLVRLASFKTLLVEPVFPKIKKKD